MSSAAGSVSAPGEIRTAVLLAAGAGSRLDASPAAPPKCLWPVAGMSILERALRALESNGIERLVIVVGYRQQLIREAVARSGCDLAVEFVVNEDFARSENIVSLWLAAERVDDALLLLESDLLFAADLLRPMLSPGRIAVSRPAAWMHGTRIRPGPGDALGEFVFPPFARDEELLKTVNIYSLDRGDWRRVVDNLGRCIRGGEVGVFYERVFADMQRAGELAFSLVDFPRDRWYEVDTPADLEAADRLFRVGV